MAFCHNGHSDTVYSGGALPGHKLLDGDFHIQLRVQGQIGDTEAAPAQYPPDDGLLVEWPISMANAPLSTLKLIF